MDRWQRKCPRACYTALTDILFDTLLHDYHPVIASGILSDDAASSIDPLSNGDSLIKPALFAAPNPLCMVYIICMIPSSFLGVNSVPILLHVQRSLPADSWIMRCAMHHLTLRRWCGLKGSRSVQSEQIYSYTAIVPPGR